MLLVESIEQHENRAECNDTREDELVFPLFDVDALDERIDPRKGVCEIVESILKPFERFTLRLERFICFNSYTDLVINQVVGAGT
jgi:hypothetical protein